MPLIATDTVTTLNEIQIDQDHLQFADLINQMETAADTEFQALFQQLLEHVESHFGYENQLMESTGFPALAEHKGEHHRVLGQLHQFASRVNNGRINFAKAYICEQLPGWFRLHLSTMDSALVAHVHKGTLQQQV